MAAKVLVLFVIHIQVLVTRKQWQYGAQCRSIAHDPGKTLQLGLKPWAGLALLSSGPDQTILNLVWVLSISYTLWSVTTLTTVWSNSEIFAVQLQCISISTSAIIIQATNHYGWSRIVIIQVHRHADNRISYNLSKSLCPFSGMQKESPESQWMRLHECFSA